ncbi:MAG: ferrous iron transport protein A [Firmicutes bacterium]|nr:ferrous iron transport protein A [Bacillota bacterium]
MNQNANNTAKKTCEGEINIPLDCLGTGNSGIIYSVEGEKALRKRLLDMGLTPKTEIMIRKVAPLGDPMELCLRGYELTLRRADAHYITVRLKETAPKDE